MKKISCTVMALIACATLYGQRTLNQDSCEALALQNNKDLQIADEEVKQAEYEKKSAFAQYFPDISIKGGYLRNEKQLALLGEDQYLPICYAGGADGSIAVDQSQIANKMVAYNGSYVPLDANGQPFDPTKNPEKIIWKNYTTIPKDQMTFDTRNIYVGVLNLTQPIFMGGKIVAYNKVCDLKKELADSKKETSRQEVLKNVDEAYWRTVSLYSKKKAVQGLIDLLDTMQNNVNEMVDEGVATKKDQLTVAVKRNEAKMTMVKVDNGIKLYKMQLAQYCGLPIEEDYEIADKDLKDIPVKEEPKPSSDEVKNNRPELKSLELANALYDQKTTIARAALLPTVALTANYLASNPNCYDGFENKFGYEWNIGIVVNIPLFHFGADYYKWQAAKSEATVAKLQYDDTEEKVNLQVNQYSYKQTEALRKLDVANKNMDEAQENLRMAQLSFEAGVISTSNLLEAQTAWLGAQSDKIDAEIDAKINGIYLRRAGGNLGK
jgi:outer membrane protein